MTSNVITLAGARVHPVTIAQARVHLLDRMKLRGARPNTLEAYRRDLQDFEQFCGEAQQITLVGLISDRVAERWLDRLGHRGVSPRSCARKLASLRALCRHGRKEGWLQHDPTKDVQVRIRMKRVIAPEREQLLELLDAIPAHGVLNLRDRAMLRVTFDAALRVGETTGLDLWDPQQPPRAFVDERRLMVQVVGKGGDDETAPINARTLEFIRDWLAVRHVLAKPGERALFVSNRGGRITRQMAHYRLKAWGASVGLPHMHYHLLRHRRLGDVIDKLGLDAGQRLARHVSRATTAAIYGAHADEVLRTQIRRECDLDAGRAVA